MDSVSQFVLGSSVAAAILGPKLGARALLLGGVVATLPDLDSFLPYENALDAVTYHRGFSHSLLVQTAVSPLLAGLTYQVFKKQPVSYPLMLLTVWLCLITHSFLDSLTTYGTQLLWPLNVGSPFAFPSVFIIDPTYTVTLIIGLIGFLWFTRSKRLRAVKFARVCLALSSLYLCLGMAGHLYVKNKAANHPLLAGKRIHVQPTPFNILYWQVLAIDEMHYYASATSVLNGCSDLTIHKYPRQLQVSSSEKTLALPQSVKRFEWFTNGFYNYGTGDDGAVKISDLRIGFAPFFPFSYLFGTVAASGIVPHPPRRANGPKRSLASLTQLYDFARKPPKGCW